jgi:uncharacterized protein (TIGR02466 family)
MTNAQIYQLFPTTIYKNQINKNLTKSELDFIISQKSKIHKNIGNKSSNDTYILENKELVNLKKQILNFVDDHTKNVLAVDTKKVTPYITQSWLNFTNVNEFHHLHHHTNSYLSGVFYIKAKKDVDKIFFEKDMNYILHPEFTEFNINNSNSWWLPVETGEIILFSSKLKHFVEKVEKTDERISLAFNVFLKGTIGNNQDFTELVL